MTDFFNKNKTAILGGILVVLGLWAYFTYFGGGGAPLTASSADASVSGDLLVTLNSLNVIRLDDSIFKDPVFGSLSDFGTPLPEPTPGRRNPFAPVGQGGSLGTSTAH